MAALRFFIFGYGAGVLAGIGTGAIYGSLVGWLMAWLGGSCFSLLLALLWYRSDQAARLAGLDHPNLVAWDRDLSEEMLASDQRTDATATATARPTSRTRDRRRA
ncbi:MAG: hypothetical protein AAGJ28_02350 [Pseudomonadota bacterium]